MLVFLPDEQKPKTCNDVFLKSCRQIKVNPELLLNRKNITIPGLGIKEETLQYENGFDNSRSLCFKGPMGSELVAIFSSDGKSMFGTLHTSEGRVFAIEFAGNDTSVLKEMDLSILEPYDPMESFGFRNCSF